MTSQPLSHKEEYAKKRRKKFLLKYGLILFIFVCLFFGLVFLSRMDRFRVSNIKLSGGSLVTESDVSEATKGFLLGNYLWFFPKNNDLLYPKDDLQIFLKDKFKRIDNISVSLNDFKTLNIVITERSLNSLWCDNLPDSGLQENCYFMDGNGLIFTEAPQFSGDAYFKYYGLVPTSTLPIGSQYIVPTSLFKDFTEFIRRVDKLSLHPISLIAKDDGQFILNLSDGGSIYIGMKEPLSKTADNLEALLGTISATTTYSSLKIDYIDLRFGNKLYYKLK